MTIQDHFAGKNILITGGTGFIGKALIEKLLRSCPNLGNIYILIRGKKDKTPQERLECIIQNGLFDVLRNSNPVALNKLIAVNGDVTKLKLGVNEEDRQLLIENIHFIYHMAASVRFDEFLKESILVNVRSTREAIKLAYEMKNLSTFIHVSTTYCHVDKDVVEEKVYPCRGNWQEAIKLAEEMDENVLDILTMKYISPMPNVYTYVKGLAESLVHDMCKEKIHAIIMRPSIVISTLDDPIPGWVDNFNGPIGMVTASGKGIIQAVYGNSNARLDHIPVDVFCKLLIIAPTEKFRTISDEIQIYNCSNFKGTCFTLQKLQDMGYRLANDIPFSQALWYMRSSITRCWFNYFSRVILFHIIPALFLDLGLKLFGRKPILLKLQRKIFIANTVLFSFMSKTYNFSNCNAVKAVQKVPPENLVDFGGQKILNSESDDDLYQYFKDATVGINTYLFKEKYDLEGSRRAMKRLRWLDIAVRLIFKLVLFWYVCSYIGQMLA